MTNEELNVSVWKDLEDVYSNRAWEDLAELHDKIIKKIYDREKRIQIRPKLQQS